MMHRSWLLKALTLGLLVSLLAGSGSALAAPPAPDALPRGVCPTQSTSVPIPMGVSVTLQRPNSPAPSAAWAVPVTFVLYPPGDSVTICRQWELTLNTSGVWNGYLDLYSLGRYDARIRNLHTLRNVKSDLDIFGPMMINMGTLYEGDANGDNTVNILDFGKLRTSYFLDEGLPGFDPAADFDENNTINILDFGLLRGNYFKDGDIVVPALTSAAAAPVAAPVTITLRPLARDLAVGEVAGFGVWADATAQPLQGLDVELFYWLRSVAVTDAAGNPATTITPGAAFDYVLQNRVAPVDVQTGRILFSAATFDAPATGQVEIARFYLKGLAPGPAGVQFGKKTSGLEPSGQKAQLTLDRPVITVGGISNRFYYPLGLK